MIHAVITTCLLAICLGTCPTVLAQPAKGLAQQKGWYLDLESARKLARQTGNPLLVVFRCEA